MFLKNLEPYEIILASKSPRRQQLLSESGLKFTVKPMDVPEKYPDDLKMTEIPMFLSELKAEAFRPHLQKNQIVITADTIVWIDGQVLGKPNGHDDAVRMLSLLAGKKHEVITGVCLLSPEKKISFHSVTGVWFKPLSDEEIHYYIDHYRPYDKAGAYGIQEWIGYIGIYRIEGSFFNVMGLPVQSVYEHLKKF
jgi:septum formation protein